MVGTSEPGRRFARGRPERTGGGSGCGYDEAKQGRERAEGRGCHPPHPTGIGATHSRPQFYFTPSVSRDGEHVPRTGWRRDPVRALPFIVSSRSPPSERHRTRIAAYTRSASGGMSKLIPPRRAEGPSGSVAQWRGPRMRPGSVARATPRARPTSVRWSGGERSASGDSRPLSLPLFPGESGLVRASSHH